MFESDDVVADHAPPFERINPEGPPEILLVCDHASNALPYEYGTLGLPPEEFERHIAYDVGARGVTLSLARILGAPALLHNYSRLLIDPNRDERDPTLVMTLSDGAIIPGNRHADKAEIENRIRRFHAPYHAAIEAQIDRALALGVAPAIFSIHSFTPRMKLGPERPWHVGVLWHRDNRLAEPLLLRLRGEADLCVGENEPYHGALRGDCMWRHALDRGMPFGLLEIRNDLIARPEAQIAWAERLAPILREAAQGADCRPYMPSASL